MDLWDTRWTLDPAIEISCSGVSEGFAFSEVTFEEYDVDLPNTNLRVVPDWSWPPDTSPFHFYGYYADGRFTDEWQHVAYCVFDFETEWVFTSGDRFRAPCSSRPGGFRAAAVCGDDPLVHRSAPVAAADPGRAGAQTFFCSWAFSATQSGRSTELEDVVGGEVDPCAHRAS